METAEVTMTVVNMTWPMWIYYLLAAALGALASSLVVKKGNLIWPHGKKVPEEPESSGNTNNPPKSQNIIYEKAEAMGFTGDIIVGLAAAIAILWTMTPQSLFQLIGIGAVAGYGGSTILQSLVNKIKADTSDTEMEKNRLQNKQKETEATQKELNNASLNAFLTEILAKYKK
jgi:hypothetical protein